MMKTVRGLAIKVTTAIMVASAAMCAMTPMMVRADEIPDTDDYVEYIMEDTCNVEDSTVSEEPDWNSEVLETPVVDEICEMPMEEIIVDEAWEAPMEEMIVDEVWEAPMEEIVVDEVWENPMEESVVEEEVEIPASEWEMNVDSEVEEGLTEDDERDELDSDDVDEPDEPEEPEEPSTKKKVASKKTKKKAVPGYNSKTGAPKLRTMTTGEILFGYSGTRVDYENLEVGKFYVMQKPRHRSRKLAPVTFRCSAIKVLKIEDGGGYNWLNKSVTVYYKAYDKNGKALKGTKKANVAETILNQTPPHFYEVTDDILNKN